MPRNEIAAIVGLVVVAFYLLAGPARSRGLPRSAKGIATAATVFVIAFLVTWIVLRLLNY
jgi:hypothetical protein